MSGFMSCKIWNMEKFAVYSRVSSSHPSLHLRIWRIHFPSTKLSKSSMQTKVTLVFANCICDIVVSMDVTTVIYNLEGAVMAPGIIFWPVKPFCRIFFSLSLISVALVGVWIYVVMKNCLMTYRTRVFMAALVYLKALKPRESFLFIKNH